MRSILILFAIIAGVCIMLASCTYTPRQTLMKVDKYWVTGAIDNPDYRFVTTTTMQLDTLYNVGDTVRPVSTSLQDYIYVVKKK